MKTTFEEVNFILPYCPFCGKKTYVSFIGFTNNKNGTQLRILNELCCTKCSKNFFTISKILE